ncbi:hypothetical protein CJ305_03670 [Leeuwenhoekiella nanhaiensis]|uniref:histidine kinase n=1 Tax=Leeuwenhoekiella nanhaiensis TaxID=1655491 RepID=A0A2G1VTG7_9FLAO|nr:hypothetical protein CJ305_03670 [Leeuwenhoekiella nanhaiensis]
MLYLKSEAPFSIISTIVIVKNFIILLFYGCFLVPVMAQSDLEFTQLSAGNVPTQSITYRVEQDSLGIIWVATEEGILRHDSNNSKIYNTYNGLPESLSNRSQSLFIDRSGNLWAGTDKGICYYNKDLDRFDAVDLEDAINPAVVKAFAQTAEGTVWVGAFNGVWEVNPKTQKLKQHFETIGVQSLVAVDNTLFIGTTSGLFKATEGGKVTTAFSGLKNTSITYTGLLDGRLYIGNRAGELYSATSDLNRLELTAFSCPGRVNITDVIKDSDGNFYIATDGLGVFYTSPNFEILAQYKDDDNNPNSLSSNGVYDLLLGDQNILWIATYGGGVNYYDSSARSFDKIRHRINDANSIISNFTRAIAQDQKGNLWFGTKKGLSIYNEQNQTWKHIKKLGSQTNLNADIVLALEPDGNFMWVGTYNDGAYKVNINSLQSTSYNPTIKPEVGVDKVYAILKTRDGSVWFGGVDGTLTQIKNDRVAKTLPIRQIKNLVQDQEGMILASGRNGIYRINPDTYEFTLVEAIKPDKNTLAYSTVNAVQPFQDRYYIATNGAGVLIYNRDTEEVKRLDIGSGLPSDIVQGILLEDEQNIWAGTANGLAHIKMSETDTLINVYDTNDGLAGTEFNYGSFARFSDGRFAFGGTRGVSIFDPTRIEAKDAAPKIVFTDFKLFNKSVTPGEKPLFKHINETHKLILPHTENSIAFDFAGILHNASKVKYSWRLKGFDEEWTEPVSITTATYTNLNPGDYTFEIKAANKFGEYGPVRKLEIIILSPWWATTEAYILYALLVIGLIILTIHITRILVNKRNAEEQIAFFNNITHEIKTPLTVLLSSLDSVSAESDSDKKSNKRVKATVKRINSLFEQMLNFHKVTSQNSVTENIEKINLVKYFNRLQKDLAPLLEERDLHIEIENKWGNAPYYQDIEVFNKIVLNLISNAIKYSFEGEIIQVKLSQLYNNTLKVIVADEGMGIPQDQQKFILKRYYRARNVINSQRPGTGLGLIMVKKLIDKLDGNISFESQENRGTTFTLILKSREELFEKQERLRRAFEEKEPKYTLEPELISQFADSKILVVEDNDQLRDLIVENLSHYFDVHEAINGQAGFDLAQELFPDLILTDLIMPEMDGLEFAKAVKDDINLNHIPVFMMTVLQNSTQKLESIESGVAEYIEKPLDMQLLKAKIINALKWQKKLREKYVHESDSESAALFKNKSDQEFVNSLEATVLENLENNNFSVNELAQNFGMSRTSLYMKLKNLVDLSPQDFIIHTRLKHAKTLLIRGDISIKEVAYSSGFSNPKYFSTSFKKFYGMSPSKFVSSLQGDAS